jgi:hypothetical protein
MTCKAFSGSYHMRLDHFKILENMRFTGRIQLVEEIRTGILSIQQSTRQYQITGSVLQGWNRWYFKIRLLKYENRQKIPVFRY